MSNRNSGQSRWFGARGVLSLLFFTSLIGTIFSTTSTCGAWDADGATGTWSLAVQIDADYPDFTYAGKAWFQTAPLTVCVGATCNYIYAPYYTTYVKKYRMQLDTTCHEYKLRPTEEGRFTLKTMVTSEGGLTTQWDNPQVVGQPDEMRGYSGNLYNTAGAFTDIFYCFESGINFMQYDRDLTFEPNPGRFRIGQYMDQIFPCVDLQSVEGVGLEMGMQIDAASAMAAGRMDDRANIIVPTTARVWVFGETVPVTTARPFAQLDLNGYTSFDIVADTVDAGIVDSASRRYTYVYQFLLKRLETNGQVFRHSDDQSTPSPRMYMQSLYCGTGCFSDDRRLMLNFYEDTLNDGLVLDSENIDTWFYLTSNKWYQIGVRADDGIMTYMIDGYGAATKHHTYTLTFADSQSTQFGRTDGVIQPAEVGDFRFYNDQTLLGSEMVQLYLDYMQLRTGCGDGTRNQNEECDDGNLLSGDGCDADCQLEAGYVCYGGNSTSVRADTCKAGYYALVLDFDDDSSYNGGITVDEDLYTASPNTFSATYWTEFTPGSSPVTSIGVCSGVSYIGVGVFAAGQRLEYARSSLPPHNYIEVEGVLALVDLWSTSARHIITIDSLGVQTYRKAHGVNTVGSRFRRRSDLGNSCLNAPRTDDYIPFKISAFHNSSTILMKMNTTGGAGNGVMSWGLSYINIKYGLTPGFIGRTNIGMYVKPTAASSRTYGYFSYPGVNHVSSRGLELFANTTVSGNSYTDASLTRNQIFLPIYDYLKKGDFMEFFFKVDLWSQTHTTFIVELIKLQPSQTFNGNLYWYTMEHCEPTNSVSPTCANAYHYRICYNAVNIPATTYCDESRRVPLHSWNQETIIMSDKFTHKYGNTIGDSTARYAVIFGLRANAGNPMRELKIFVDDFKIGSISQVVSSCPNLIAKGSVAGATSLMIGATEYSLNLAGYNVLRVDPSDHSVIGAAQNFATEALMYAFVADLDFGDIVMIASKGLSLGCSTVCDNTLVYIGASGYPWGLADSASFAVIGRVGGAPRSMPFRSLASTDGDSTVTSVLSCMKVTTVISEKSSDWTPLGEPMVYTGQHLYELEGDSMGFLGCYRFGTTITRFNCNAGTRNSPGFCAKCCADIGFAYGHVHDQGTCNCAQTYGTETCNTLNQCGGPQVSDDVCQVWDNRCNGDAAQHCSQVSTSLGYSSYKAIATTGAIPLPAAMAVMSCIGADSTNCDKVVDGCLTQLSEACRYQSFGYLLLPNGDSAVIQYNFTTPIYVERFGFHWFDDVDNHPQEWVLEVVAEGTNYWQELYHNYDAWTSYLTLGNGVYDRMESVKNSISSRLIAARLSMNGKGGENDEYFILVEGMVMYFPSKADRDSTAVLRANSMSWAKLALSYATLYRSTPAHFTLNEMLHVRAGDGQVYNFINVFNKEVQPYYIIMTSAVENTYDSGQMTGLGTPFFFAYNHGLGSTPLAVSVRIRATAGANLGYEFTGQGSVYRDNNQYTHPYGGVLFAWSATDIRIWLPSDASWGMMINICDGWDANYESRTNSATVRIRASIGSAPDFDSGWYSMASNDNILSQSVVTHNLGDLDTSIVKVFYRPTTGPNANYIFEAAGTAMNDNDGGNYGGIIFAYNDVDVVIWAPNSLLDLDGDDCTVSTFDRQLSGTVYTCLFAGWAPGIGYAAYIPGDWGNTANNQATHPIQVRVMIYIGANSYAPRFASNWLTMSANGVALVTGYHNLYSYPETAKVAVRGGLLSTDYRFVGGGMPQNNDFLAHSYGGVVYGMTSTEYRIWTGVQSALIYNQPGGLLIHAKDGYGSGAYPIKFQSGFVKAVFWSTNVNALRYTRMSNITLQDSNDAPRLKSAAFTMKEKWPNSKPVYTFAPEDEDEFSTFTYSILSGNIGNSFQIIGNQLFVNPAVGLDYETYGSYYLEIAVNDGSLSDKAFLTITVKDANDPPSLRPPYTFEVLEASSKNALVGELNSTDVDFSQSVLHYITDGNIDDTFYVNTCGGQIRVNKPNNLDFEQVSGFNNFTLTIFLTDDGPDPGNTTWIVTVNVTNRNEVPYWLGEADNVSKVFTIEENAVNGTFIGNVDSWCKDPDTYDRHRYNIILVSVGGGEISENETDFGAAAAMNLFSVNVSSGDLYVGVGEIDYEDGASSYDLLIRCIDYLPAQYAYIEQGGTENLYVDTFVTVNVQNVNDPPTFAFSTFNFDMDEATAGLYTLGTALATDDDGDAILYEMVDPSGFFTIDSATGQIDTIMLTTSTFNFEATSSYAFTVYATDYSLDPNITLNNFTVSASVLVSINDINEAPAITPVNGTVAENSLAGTLITIINATDADILSSQTVFFSVNIVTPALAAGYVQLESTGTGRSAFLNVGFTNINFELLAQPFFVVNVKVTDSGSPSKTAFQDIFVFVTDANDAPYLETALSVPCGPVGSNCESFTVAENSAINTVAGQVYAFDEDNDAFVFDISLLNSPLVYLLKALPNGEIQVNQSVLNFESTEVYLFTIKATEAVTAEMYTDTAQYRLTVLDIPEAPFVIQTPYTVDVTTSEKTVLNDTFGVQIEPYFDDEDQNDYLVFTFDAVVLKFLNGTYSFVPNPFRPYKQFPSFSILQVKSIDDLGAAETLFYFNITATDKDGLTTKLAAVIEVISANEPPNWVSTGPCSVDENVAGGTFICLAGVSDDNGDLTYDFDIVDDQNQTFTILPLNKTHTQIVTYVNAQIDYESVNFYTIILKVTDSRLLEPAMSSFASVDISINDLNDPPASLQTLWEFNAAENVAPGFVIGSVFYADEDVGTNLAFSVTDSSGKFTCVDVGLLQCDVTLLAGQSLDFETTTIFSFMVSATDGVGGFSNTFVDIHVTDINEAPQIPAGSKSLYVQENAPASAKTVRIGISLTSSTIIDLYDPENDDLTVTIISTSLGVSNCFIITKLSNTQIMMEVDTSFSILMDFESDPTIDVNLQLSDGQLLTLDSVVVNLDNVNDVVITSLSVGALSTDFPLLGPVVVDSNGGSIVTITGSSFGNLYLPAPTVTATFGGVGTEYSTSACSVTVANTEIQCTAGTGIGTNQRWIVTINPGVWDHSATSTVFTHFYRPTITSLTMPDPILTRGGSIMTVTGTDFGDPLQSYWQFSGLVVAAPIASSYEIVSSTTGVYICWADFVLWSMATSSVLTVDGRLESASGDVIDVTINTVGADNSGYDVLDYADSTCSLLTAGSSFFNANNGLPRRDGGKLNQNNLWIASSRFPRIRASVTPDSGQAAALSALLGQDLSLFVRHVPRVVMVHAGDGTFTDGLVVPSCTAITNAQIECSLPAGVGFNYQAYLIVGSTISDISDDSISYPEPIINDLINAADVDLLMLDTYGDEAVTISGAFFGTDNAYDNYGYGEVGYGLAPYYLPSCYVVNTANQINVTYQASTILADEDYLICQTEPGVGAGKAWYARVGGQTSLTSTETTTYRPPIILSMEEGDWPFSTRGDDPVTITGRNFGPLGINALLRPIETRYGRSTQFTAGTYFYVSDCTIIYSSQEDDEQMMLCTSAEGTGTDHSWITRVDNQFSNLYFANSSYSPPLLSSFEVGLSSNFPVNLVDYSTAGGQYVLVNGENFGPKTFANGYVSDIYGIATYFDDETSVVFPWYHDNCTVTVDHVQMRCLTVEGVGGQLTWNFFVDGQKNVLASTSYGAPVVTGVVGFGFDINDGMDTFGEQTIILTGLNFGYNMSYLEKVSYGPSGTEYVLYNIFLQSTYGRCDLTVAHTEITCLTVNGLGKNHKILVTVAGQRTPSSYVGPLIRYTEPVITAILDKDMDGLTSNAFRMNNDQMGPTDGGYRVSVTGTDFGPAGDYMISLGGYYALEYADEGTTSNIAVVESFPAGQGVYSLQVLQTNSFCTGSCVQASAIHTWTFYDPYIDDYTSTEIPTNQTVNGTKLIRLSLKGNSNIGGGSFGAAELYYGLDGMQSEVENEVRIYPLSKNISTGSALIAAGGEFANCTFEITDPLDEWGHSKVSCKTTKTKGSVVLIVGGVPSNTIHYEDLDPSLISKTIDASMFGGVLSTQGGWILTVLGLYLGTIDSANGTTSTTVGFYLEDYLWVPCMNVRLFSISSTNCFGNDNCQLLNCTASAGAGMQVGIVVDRDGRTNDFVSGSDCTYYPESCFDYDEPNVQDIDPDFSVRRKLLGGTLKIDTTGLPQLTLTGDDFGPGDTTWVRVFAEKNGLKSDPLTRIFPPTINNHTTIIVVIEPGTPGEVRYLEIQVANQFYGGYSPEPSDVLNVDYFEFKIEYNAASISTVVVGGNAINSLDMLTNGGESVTITGTNFGAMEVNGNFPDDTTAQLIELMEIASDPVAGYVEVTFDARNAYKKSKFEVVSWDHTSIIINTPEGEGVINDLRFFVSSMGSINLADYVTYTVPSISSIFPTSMSTTGGLNITITGDNFGTIYANQRKINFGSSIATLNQLSNYYVIGSQIAGPVVWDHNQIIFPVPAGEGYNIPISITSEGQQSAVDTSFSYNPPLVTGFQCGATVNDLCNYDGGSTMACELLESVDTYKKRAALDPTTKRECFRKEFITIIGDSFGQDGGVDIKVDGNELVCITDPASPNYRKDTNASWDCLDCDENCLPTTNGNGVNSGCDDSCILIDTMIMVRAPQSYGKNKSVEVFYDNIKDPSSVELFYTYDPPKIDSTFPNPMDAKGGYTLTIQGRNFGGISTSTIVEFGKHANGTLLYKINCTSATWNSPTVVNNGLPYITCYVERVVVGGQDIWVKVAGQVGFVSGSAINPLVNARCEYETDEFGSVTPYYGVEFYNEYCLECPDESDCYHTRSNSWKFEPQALPGFWKLYYPIDSTRAKERCPAERRQAPCTRTECPDFVGCIPDSSCKGYQQCTNGYTYLKEICEDELRKFNSSGKINMAQCRNNEDCTLGKSCDLGTEEGCAICNKTMPSDTFGECICTSFDRCAYCTVFEYYRINGECQACPQNVWVIIGLFISALVLFTLAGYWLNKKKFNLAFISIGFDYFQVLAVFASSDIPWPGILLQLFLLLEFFSFNIDITAPECVMPDFTYEMKWGLTMVLPLCALVLFILMHIFYVLEKLLVEKITKWKKLNDHYVTLIAMFVIMLYYLYLPLTRKILDVFNCNPAVPDDGYTYTEWTSLNCDGGLCRCWVDGEPQMFLVPFAVLFLLIYSIGFPLFAAFTILTNINRVKEDQLLRAMDLGDTLATNPDCFELRQKYHKLYYHFKPGKVYWILVILARKFWIAVAALLFRANPSFQLSFMLLVLFTSFVLQVKHRPFMSSVEKKKEVDRHKRKVEDEKERLAETGGKMMAGMSKVHMLIEQHLQVIEKQRQVEDKRKKIGKEIDDVRRDDDDKKNYFWDYNTVELVLLGCAIFVCTAGIMFQSQENEDRADLTTHLEVLAVLTLLVIIGSLVYYFSVFLSEVFTTIGLENNRFIRMFMNRLENKKLVQKQDLDDFQLTAISLQKAVVEEKKEEVDPFTKEMQTLQEEHEKLLNAVAELKRQNKALELSDPSNQQTGRRGRKKKSAEGDDDGKDVDAGGGERGSTADEADV